MDQKTFEYFKRRAERARELGLHGHAAMELATLASEDLPRLMGWIERYRMAQSDAGACDWCSEQGPLTQRGADFLCTTCIRGAERRDNLDRVIPGGSK